MHKSTYETDTETYGEVQPSVKSLPLPHTYSNSTNSLLYYELGQDSQLLSDSENYNRSCSLPLLRDCDLSGLTKDQNWSIDVDYEGERGEFTSWDFSPNETRIQYCLSERIDEHCRLQFSLVTMIVVIMCNLIHIASDAKIRYIINAGTIVEDGQ